MYLVHGMFQKEVAKYYRITPAVVSRIVKEYQEDPEKKSKLIKLEENIIKEEMLIKQTVCDLLQNQDHIFKAEQIVDRAAQDTGIQVTVDKVRKIMKDQLGMKYRKSKKISELANSQRCLVLRQQYAMKMLEILKDDVLVINID